MTPAMKQVIRDRVASLKAKSANGLLPGLRVFYEDACDIESALAALESESADDVHAQELMELKASRDAWKSLAEALDPNTMYDDHPADIRRHWHADRVKAIQTAREALPAPPKEKP